MVAKLIPFNRAHLSGKELDYVGQTWERLQMAADGPFTHRCQDFLRQRLGACSAILTSSATDALELASILLDLKPGDEVIMPSYTFVSTANAFALRGAVPVFVDIRPDTLNLDEAQIERAITSKTRAIVPVHYAGVVCEMDAILPIAKKHNLFVIEDAAQAIGSSYKGRPAGSFGHFSAFSFHETKNVSAGEGGALVINDDRFASRADVVSQKGTDRKRFLEGQVDKYTWRDLGSSFMPSEIIAAYLWAQLEHLDRIQEKRKTVWQTYHRFFLNSPVREFFDLPRVPSHCEDNQHLYYLLAKQTSWRDELCRYLNERGVQAIFHYIPLHLSEGGQRYARAASALPVTERTAAGILRLPLWIGMTDEQIGRVCAIVQEFVLSKR